MLQLTPQSRVFLALEPADFRRGIDGLSALCRQRLGEDPFGGAIFVFRNRRGTSLKLLCYDLGEAPRYVELWEAIAPYSQISQASSPLELHIMQLPSEGLQPGQDGCVGSPSGEGRLGELRNKCEATGLKDTVIKDRYVRRTPRA